jgi:hypothetical protein
MALAYERTMTGAAGHQSRRQRGRRGSTTALRAYRSSLERAGASAVLSSAMMNEETACLCHGETAASGAARCLIRKP